MRTVVRLVVLGVALPLATGAQQIQISKENKTIAITTSADAQATADVAIVTVGFHVYGKDPESTYATASPTSNAIIAALTAAGVPKTAIQSQDQSLSPLQANSEEDKARFAQGVRFEFSESWHVTVAADQAANVLHLAIIAGANDSGNIDWQLRSDDAVQSDAAANALEHARQIAESMAKGLGAHLGALVYASNQAPPRGIFANMGFGNVSLETSNASVGMRAKNLKPLAISAPKLTRSATVYAVFSIE
jgi:uncharacterized protein YggE